MSDYFYAGPAGTISVWRAFRKVRFAPARELSLYLLYTPRDADLLRAPRRVFQIYFREAPPGYL